MIKKILSDSIKVKEKLIKDNQFLHNLQDAIQLITTAIKNGKKILIMGNGGSAADAQHFAGEFINRFLLERSPLPAISLSSDTSVLTCIGNDYSFDDVFKKQIEGIGSNGDILIGLSTSGNSKNIINGFKAAKIKGLINIAILGKDGGDAKNFSDISLIVRSDCTPRIQETHITIIHIICEIVEKSIFGTN